MAGSIFKGIASAQIAKPPQDTLYPEPTRISPIVSDDELEVFTPQRIELSDDQAAAFSQMHAWEREKSNLLTLGGYAGTGKTTLIARFAQEFLDYKRIAFCAFTGKAASVLKHKLAAFGVRSNKYCGTIHGLIYLPDCDEKTGEILRWKRREFLEVDLVIVDEASMVGKRLWEDLRSFGVPILAVGDHGQLPPVGDEQVSLVQNPNIRLERVHRQAEGNPILRLATHVRTLQPLSEFENTPGDDRVKFWPDFESLEANIEKPADMLESPIICYFNRTRVGLNDYIRKNFEYPPLPVPQDIVICLKNNREARIFNGMRGVVEESELVKHKQPWKRVATTVRFDTEKLRLHAELCASQFGNESTFKMISEIAGHPPSWGQAGLLFDYGYAMTCHKSQGSQFDQVILKVEGRFDTFQERCRWLYTAITRAVKQIHVIGG